MNATAPTPPSGHPPAPDPDTRIRLDPAAPEQVRAFGVSLIELADRAAARSAPTPSVPDLHGMSGVAA